MAIKKKAVLTESDETKPSSRHPRAGFVVRTGALVVDGVIVGVISTVVVMTVVLAALSWATYWVYSVLMLVHLDGATVGKKLFGIKVVAETPKISFGTAVLREVVGKLISGLIFGLGYLWVIWDKDKAAWHDKIAGTDVVHVSPYTAGRKIAAWVITILMFLAVIGSPILIILGLVPIVNYLRNNPGSVNYSIQQLQELQDSNGQLQKSLEELKALQRQLESSSEGTMGQN